LGSSSSWNWCDDEPDQECIGSCQGAEGCYTEFHPDSTLALAADGFLLSWSQEYKEKGTMQRIKLSKKALQKFEEESEYSEDMSLFVEMFRRTAFDWYNYCHNKASRTTIIRHVLRFIEVFETYMPLYMREPSVYTMRGELRRCMKKITGRSLWDTWWHGYDDLPENAIEWDIEVSESDKNLIRNMAM
jgi:hypothetical protein